MPILSIAIITYWTAKLAIALGWYDTNLESLHQLSAIALHTTSKATSDVLAVHFLAQLIVFPVYFWIVFRRLSPAIHEQARVLIRQLAGGLLMIALSSALLFLPVGSAPMASGGPRFPEIVNGHSYMLYSLFLAALFFLLSTGLGLVLCSIKKARSPVIE